MIYESRFSTSQSRALLEPTERETTSSLPVVCFSHLRWGFVWQRPQHLLTRIARNRPVYLVEEPLIHIDKHDPCLRVTKDADVTILTPSLPQSRHSQRRFCGENNGVIRELLSDYFQEELSEPDVIAWYYTPMALGTLPQDLHTSLTVFDAMDELANFRGAPRELRVQERLLMESADLVFAGGPSLYEARKFRHPRTFCFPSGVEASHFQSTTGPRPDDIAAITSPVVGFYGVLDERIDFDLVGGIADARPDWSIVMIGPVVKIDQSQLIHRPNIHYLGMKTYAELPRYLAHFDAAILPFALNEATRFISPTKTLEYLAGGKPVVSTAIEDVIQLYGDVTEIAHTPREFVAAIEQLWNASSAEEESRATMVRSILKEHDWDVVAGRMQLLLIEAMNRERAPHVAQGEVETRGIPDSVNAPVNTRGVLD